MATTRTTLVATSWSAFIVGVGSALGVLATMGRQIVAAANARLAGLPPQGRQYEMGGATSGYAIGGVTSQGVSNGRKLRVLLYYSARLSECQQTWHPTSQKS